MLAPLETCSLCDHNHVFCIVFVWPIQLRRWISIKQQVASNKKQVFIADGSCVRNMTEEPGKRWRHIIQYSAYYNSIYNCNDLYKNQWIRCYYSLLRTL